MLLIIIILILLLGIALSRCGNEFDTLADNCKFIGSIGLAVSILIMCVFYIGLDGFVASNEVRYDTLRFKWSHIDDIYCCDTCKENVINEIQEWNEDLACYKRLQRNIWIGVYIPNVFDRFNLIRLDNILELKGDTNDSYRS